MKKIFIYSLQDCSASSHHVITSTPATTGKSDNSKAEEQKNLAASDVVMKAFQTGM